MMREQDREVAKKVLDYWFTLEFLAQDKYPETGKLRNEVEQFKGRTGKDSVKRKKILWDAVSLEGICGSERLMDVAFAEAVACGMKCWGNMTVYLGKVKREACIHWIGRALPGKGTERPEMSREAIAWASFQVTPEGRYCSHSLSLSPMVWALKQIRNCSRGLSGCLDEKKYRAAVEGLEERLFGQHSQEEEGLMVTVEILKALSGTIRKEYIEEVFCTEEHGKEDMGSQEDMDFGLEEKYDIFFPLFGDEETRDREEGESFSGLSRDFYSRDMKLVMDFLETPPNLDGLEIQAQRQEKVQRQIQIQTEAQIQRQVQIQTQAQIQTQSQVEGEGGHEAGMLGDLVRYICGPYHESKGEKGVRIDLVHPQGQVVKVYARQLGEILDVRRAPMGKWPSPFMPALMQQIAINLGIHSGESLFGETAGRIFSVNGPPGTGKTTLLKEIIVDHIVERAMAMSQYLDPNKAFGRRDFQHGEKAEHGYSKYTRHWYQLMDERILDCSILVASCNNGAVENISRKLPVSKEIPELLHLPPEERDIYFTEYAKVLFGQEDAWGLIAAPLGKQANIKRFYQGVIKPLLWDNFRNKDMAKERIERYHQARQRFLEQWNRVKGMQQAIGAVCDLQREACLAREREERIALENGERITALLNEREELEERQEKRLGQLAGKAKQAEAAREREKQEELRMNELEERRQQEAEKSKALLRQEWEVRRDTGLLTKLFQKEKYEAALRLAEACKGEVREQQAVLEELEKERTDGRECLLARKEETEALEREQGLMEQERQEDQLRLEQLNRVEAELRQEIQEAKERAKKCQEEYDAAARSFSARGEDGGLAIQDGWIEDLLSQEENPSTKAQVSNPWFTKRYNREREMLFYCALQLNREFILSSNHFRDNLITLSQYWGLREGDEKERIRFHPEDALEFVPALYQSLFLLVPVLSTTFASVGRLFQDIRRPGIVGTLIVDEAGQAQPQMALGALYRSRRAVVVGDPRQIEPVVTDELTMLRKAFDQEEIKPYHSKTLSVQELADQQNGFGTYLDNGTDWPEWMGCPLLVHRRCISPMYDISNRISYQNMMKQQTRPPKAELCRQFIYEKSQWIQVEGREKGKKDHFVEAQGRKVCEMLETAFQRNEYPSVYIISPFTSVVSGMRDYLKSYCREHGNSAIHAGSPEWVQKNIGTVHTFQGKEADEVIFLLGCDREKESSGAVRWVNQNVVNVAATRAKYRFYMVGDEIAWKDSEWISTAKGILDTFAIREIQAILKEEMAEEEKQEALAAASRGLPSITSFSVDEQAGEDGENDCTIDTQSLLLPLTRELGEQELTKDQLERFGFSERGEFHQLAEEVQENLRLGIKLFDLLSPVYQFNPDLDASCCAVLFCKALEVQMRECFHGSLASLLPDYLVQEGRSRVPLSRAVKEKMMLGGFAYIIRTKKAELGRQMERQGDLAHSASWWEAFGKKADQCSRRRNQCCHAGRFSWEDQLGLLSGLFREDFAGVSEEGKGSLVGGLMFESQVGKRLILP